MFCHHAVSRIVFRIPGNITEVGILRLGVRILHRCAPEREQIWAASRLNVFVLDVALLSVSLEQSQPSRLT